MMHQSSALALQREAIGLGYESRSWQKCPEFLGE
jgi:hypothetical protein